MIGSFLLKWAFFQRIQWFSCHRLFAMFAADAAPLGSVEWTSSTSLMEIAHQLIGNLRLTTLTVSTWLWGRSRQTWWPALHSFCSAIGGLVGRRPFGSPRWACRWSGWWSTSNSWSRLLWLLQTMLHWPCPMLEPLLRRKCFDGAPPAHPDAYEVRPSDDGAPATAPSHARHERPDWMPRCHQMRTLGWGHLRDMGPIDIARAKRQRYYSSDSWKRWRKRWSIQLLPWMVLSSTSQSPKPTWPIFVADHFWFDITKISLDPGSWASASAQRTAHERHPHSLKYVVSCFQGFDDSTAIQVRKSFLNMFWISLFFFCTNVRLDLVHVQLWWQCPTIFDSIGAQVCMAPSWNVDACLISIFQLAPSVKSPARRACAPASDTVKWHTFSSNIGTSGRVTETDVQLTLISCQLFFPLTIKWPEPAVVTRACGRCRKIRALHCRDTHPFSVTNWVNRKILVTRMLIPIFWRSQFKLRSLQSLMLNCLTGLLSYHEFWDMQTLGK